MEPWQIIRTINGESVGSAPTPAAALGIALTYMNEHTGVDGVAITRPTGGFICVARTDGALVIHGALHPSAFSFPRTLTIRELAEAQGFNPDQKDER